MNGYKEMVLSHSAKGRTWKNHKYISKVNGHYVYPNNRPVGRKKRYGTSTNGVNVTGKVGESQSTITDEQLTELSNNYGQMTAAVQNAYNHSPSEISKRVLGNCVNIGKAIIKAQDTMFPVSKIARNYILFGLRGWAAIIRRCKDGR